MDRPWPGPARSKECRDQSAGAAAVHGSNVSRSNRGAGPGLLLEYWDILRRHKGTLILIAFLGLLASLLFTLPQTPIYQARASLEIQSLNENFLNMRDVSPTANEGSSSRPNPISRQQVKILQSESVLERVIAKLDLEKRLSRRTDTGRLSAWRNALGLPESQPALTREEVLRAGYQEPESSHRDQHAACRNPLRFHRPAACRRLRQRPNHRVHPAEPRGPLEDHAANGRVAHPPDGRRPDQAREIRRRATELCAGFRPAVHFGEKTTSPRRSSGSFRRNSPRPRPIVSPSNRNTSWP